MREETWICSCSLVAAMYASTTFLRQKVEQAEMNLLEAQEAYDKAQPVDTSLQLQALSARKHILEFWRKQHEKLEHAESGETGRQQAIISLNNLKLLIRTNTSLTLRNSLATAWIIACGQQTVLDLHALSITHKAIMALHWLCEVCLILAVHCGTF